MISRGFKRSALPLAIMLVLSGPIGKHRGRLGSCKGSDGIHTGPFRSLDQNTRWRRSQGRCPWHDALGGV